MVPSPVGRGQNTSLTGVRPIPDPEARLGMDPPGLWDSKENQNILKGYLGKTFLYFSSNNPSLASLAFNSSKTPIFVKIF